MNPRILNRLGPLYHSYRLFGVHNRQLETFRVNQMCKEPILLGYISLAIGKCRRDCSDAPSFAEFFCADGYYTMLANFLGASPAVGIDSDRDGWSRHMPEIARRLGLKGVRFEQREVAEITERYDIIANIGGLYHVSNPAEILRRSYELARRYLIVQTVVSMTNDDPEYFVSPAPGWTHGCRFSRSWFLTMVERDGYRILDSHFNLLEGNTRDEDRGSVYLLIEK